MIQYQRNVFFRKGDTQGPGVIRFSMQDNDEF